MPLNKKTLIIITASSILIILASVFLVKSSNQPSKYDSFASCLGEKGAKFYGAFWCPHCRSQKDIFGKSAKNLPYIECSTPDGNSQLAVCTEAGIESYPTWVFSDGSKENGQLTLEKLAEKTTCQLP
ncbi:MAG: protein disulfide isomerase family protein [Microgenomates group bacterium]